jgi:hypothetical protein
LIGKKVAGLGCGLFGNAPVPQKSSARAITSWLDQGREFYTEFSAEFFTVGTGQQKLALKLAGKLVSDVIELGCDV